MELEVLKVESVEREFRMESTGEVLPDPDPTMTVDNVVIFYSSVYPALVNAIPEGPIYEGDKIVYSFKTVLGTKG